VFAKDFHKSNYSSLQHFLVGMYNLDAFFLLCGTNWICTKQFNLHLKIMWSFW